MANAVEDALRRASAEQKERNQQVIDEARRNISLVSMQQMEDITPSGAASIERDAQIIEEAKRNIPFETMKDVDSISPPLSTPSAIEPNPKVVALNTETRSTIESIEQGPGNNYLRENAVDRAMSRPAQTQETYPPEQQQVWGR